MINLQQFDPVRMPTHVRLLMRIEVVEDMRRDCEPETPSCSVQYLQCLLTAFNNRPRAQVWEAIDYMNRRANQPAEVLK